MDEAVLRIILEDSGGGESFTPTPQPPSPSSVDTPPPPPPKPPQPPRPQPTTTASTTPQPSAPPSKLTPPQPPTPPPAPPEPPSMSPTDIRAREQYQDLNKAINLARRDTDEFGKTVEGVKGKLFQMRQGIDPQTIADIFTKGKEAARGLVRELGSINELLEKGKISPTERLQLSKSAVARAASATVETQSEQEQDEDWMKSLISPAEGASPHVLLEGQTGSGKSLAAKHIAFERMKQGQDVHVVDTHTPEAWGGAKQVFQGQSAGGEAAKFMFDTLKERKQQASEAKLAGEQPDFKPMTIVLSDFARLMRDTPQLADEFKTLLTEARKFRISIIADTTSLTGAASGIKGIEDVLANFGQKARFYAPTAEDPQRRVRIGGTGGEEYKVPDLPDYSNRRDYRLVKPASETTEDSPVGAAAAARRKFEKEKYNEEVAAEYAKLKPPEPPPQFDPMEEVNKRREAERRKAQVDEAYKKQFGGDVEKDTKAGKLLDLATKFRGAIGGFTGALVGIALDAISQLRTAQVEVQKKKRERELLLEGPPPPKPLLVPPTEPTPPPLPAKTPEPVPSTVQTVKPTQVPKPELELPEQEESVLTQPAPAAPTRPSPTTPPPTVVKVSPTVQPPVIQMAEEEEPTQAPIPPPTPTTPPKQAAPPPPPQPPVKPPATQPPPPGGEGGGVKEATEALTGASTKMIIAGAAIAAGALILNKAAQGLDNYANKYAQYSAPLAQAKAQQEVAMILGDISRAQRYGPELVRYVQAQTEMQQKYEEIKIKVLTSIEPIISAGMKILGSIFDIMSPLFELVRLVADAITPFLNTLGDIASFVGDIMKLLRKTPGGDSVGVTPAQEFYNWGVTPPPFDWGTAQ